MKFSRRSVRVDESIYDFHKENQDTHWWFVGRAAVIKEYLKYRMLPAGGKLAILDIGSGFGSMLSVLNEFGAVDVLEKNEKTFPFLVQRGANKVHISQNFPETVPDAKYDLVTLFDVLEHIEDDGSAIRAIHDKLLKERGACLVTVPAHPWMWTRHDELNHHYRRYTKTGLCDIFRTSGFQIAGVSYFMSILFPLSIMQRLIAQLAPKTEASTLAPGDSINSALLKIFSFEKHLIKRFDLPFGLSLLLNAKKT